MKQVVEFVQLKYKENIYLEKRDGFQPRKDKRWYLGSILHLYHR